MAKTKNICDEKPKVGRPSKYKDNYPDELIESMRQGITVVRFCAQISISKDTFYKWVKEHEAFADAFRTGTGYCEAFWEKWLVDNLDNKYVNAALAKLYFVNRFGWSDKTEQTNTTTVIMQDTKAIEAIRDSYKKDI